ncbi:GTP cyclohydrolase IIa [Paenibacillus aceris]|uniref:GGDEF domain-containing protein n=1 Tax=Paenibacillus aceris TaxID=869555 RepID=A0ABS4HSE4_9BACL|nr:GTP cyclohydrolase IIa [Paenibacillus aceris]MBP1960939.1 GGDEF domain-containing protein [Paenibacillus aceris]
MDSFQKLSTHSKESAGIKIGIIGPKSMVTRIVQVAKKFPTLEPVVRFSKHESETPGLSDEIKHEVEVLLLCGPVPYRKVLEKVESMIPVHYVRYNETGLYKAFYNIQKKIVNQNAAVKAISVDTVTPMMVKRFMEEIDEQDLKIICYDEVNSPTREQLADFHKDCFTRGLASGALTGLHSISTELTECRIPNEWIVPTTQDIVVALERALLSTDARKSKESQIVVGLINVDGFGKIIDRHNSEHEIQKLKLDIHRILLDYVDSLRGHLTHLGGDEYLFFTTRGIFEQETAGYKRVPLASEIYKTYQLTLSIGVGFGRTANEAGSNARTALRKSKEASGNSCFIVREDKGILGPLEMADAFVKDLEVVNPDFIKKAENANMTSSYLSRLLVAYARTGKKDYNVQELALLFDITVRSTHRLLIEWSDSGLVRTSHMEKMPKGRPRQIFQFIFLEESMKNATV